MRAIKRLTLALSLLLILPAVAQANTYTVEGCGPIGSGAFQFSQAPGGFGIHTNDCVAGIQLTNEAMGLTSLSPYDQGTNGEWGMAAPVGESIDAFGVWNSWTVGQGGWSAGWLLDGNPSLHALPAGNDCTYVTSSCNIGVSGWFGVPNASSLQQELYCDASAVSAQTCPALDPQSYTIIAAATVSDVVAQLDDPGNATPTVSGSLWDAARNSAATGAWVSGISAGSSLSLDFSASDPGGICRLEAALTDASGNIVSVAGPVMDFPATDSGSVVAAQNGLPAPFMSTLPCGATSTGTQQFSPDLALLASGTYHVNVLAQNPGEYQAGTVTYATGTAFGQGYALRIDNSVPTLSVSTEQPVTADQWLTAPETVRISAGDAAVSSGLAQIRCATPTGPVTFPVTGDSANVSLTVSAPGTDTVSCVAISGAGNQSAAGTVSFRVDTQAPGVVISDAAVTPDTAGGPVALTVSAAEGVAASGVASVSCAVDGGAWQTTFGSVARVSVAGQGAHTVDCYATTTAGVNSQPVSQTVRIEAVSPTLSVTGAPPVGVWSTVPESVTMNAAAAAGAQIHAIDCQLGGMPHVYGNPVAAQTESVEVTVPPPGGQLTCQAVDSAGNVSAPQSVAFLIDDTPPVGFFLAPDPRLPDVVTVAVSDSGSGVAGAVVEMEVDGLWRHLASRWNPVAGTVTAGIPDNGSLRPGSYPLRAQVWDRAGNTALVQSTVAGAPESVRLPLRVLTSLHVKLTLGRRRRASSAAVAARPTLGYGARATVVGALAEGHHPLGGAVVELSQRILGAARFREIATARTARDGRFEFALAAGASRTIRVSYAGNAQLRGVVADAQVRVRGAVTLAAPGRALGGSLATLSGRVLGGHVPGAGLLVQLWYRVAGQPGWEPFERAVRTDRRGAWELRFVVSRAARGRRYLFRAVVAAQSGWPYEGAVSVPLQLAIG